MTEVYVRHPDGCFHCVEPLRAFNTETAATLLARARRASAHLELTGTNGVPIRVQHDSRVADRNNRLPGASSQTPSDVPGNDRLLILRRGTLDKL